MQLAGALRNQQRGWDILGIRDRVLKEQRHAGLEILHAGFLTDPLISFPAAPLLEFLEEHNSSFHNSTTGKSYPTMYVL